MTQYVDLGAVDAGCSEIDNAIDLYIDVKSKIESATSLLDCNSLKFGLFGSSSLEEQLDILKSQVDKCNSINDGVTSTIRARAQAQYNQWKSEQEAKKRKEKETANI